MSTQSILAIAGALSGTAGSIITVFSVNDILDELHLAHRFLAATVEAIATNQRDVPVFTGTERRVETAKTHSSKIVWLGVALLALGFILQAGSVLVN